MLGRTLLACAALVVAAVAETPIAFTSLPSNMTAGQPVTLTWAGGDNSPVTITLQQGLPSNLQTVQLVTGSATGNSYTFTPPTSLPDADNYAFKIQQGDNPPNYTGLIVLTGGQTSGPTNAVSASALAASTTSGSSVPTNPASGGVVAGGSSNNGTSVVSANATTTAPATTVAVGTGAVGSGSAATGTALQRNSTMSIATLSSSSHATKTSSSSTGSSTASSSGSGSGSGSTTSSGTAPSSSSKSAAVTLAASNFALLCAAVVGIAYLG